MKERIVGVLLLLVGGMLGYFCVYDPLEAAKRGDPSVSVSLKGSILAPVCLIGVMYVVLGAGVTPIMGTREHPKPAAYIISIGLIALGFGLYFWLRSTLEGYGYDFGGRF